VTRVLVIRFSSIGDIILSAPIIPSLLESFPGIQIDYLVHERFSILVKHFDPPPHRVIPFPPQIRARQLPAFARTLAAEDYDLIIDLHDSLRSRIVRRLIHPAELRIYRKPRLKRMMLFYLWINHFRPDFSVVHEYLRYACLDHNHDPEPPHLSVDQDFVRDISLRLGLEQDYIACVPGAAWPRKSWLPTRYVRLFNQFLSGNSCQILLLGGTEDHICDIIARDLESNRVLNLRSQTNLQDALALLAGARIVIGSDTGLVHAGEALGTPALMILGPTSAETGSRVHHPDSLVHENQLWCRPCSQNGKRRCYRREQYCMTGTSVGQVFESLTQLVGMV
jgi:heptosyltransferase-2